MMEYIWGCELTAENKEYVFDMNEDTENEMTCNLLLKQAVLGTSVPDKEVNVVALESFGISETISQPLFRLKAGQNDQCQLDILLTHPGSRLCLVEGSGPVHLWGQQIFECPDDDSSLKDISVMTEETEGEDEDEDVEDLKEELEFLNGDAKNEVVLPEKPKKRPASSGNERSRKKV